MEAHVPENMSYIFKKDIRISDRYTYDMSDVKGQYEAKKALEIAAAGGHNILMVGAPGVGKSMLAQRMPTILPKLTTEEAIENAVISSIQGKFSGELSYEAPYVAPHHSASSVALVGGGSQPRPGAISQAHNGILFLDELPEFQSSVLQSLRQPMENGYIEIHRARMSVRYPAAFQFVGAANPCRCGKYLENPQACTCKTHDRVAYFQKIGGPLLDRLDVHMVLRRMRRSDMLHAHTGESSSSIRHRVVEARERQKHRLKKERWNKNSDVSSSWLSSHTHVPDSINDTFEEYLSLGVMSMRAINKILRLSWTLADLQAKNKPTADEMNQALMFRFSTIDMR